MQEILKEINYKFEKNKSYAIVGTSGSGKTTLINLLLGKFNNYSGDIYYNNTELKEISIDSLFESINETIPDFIEEGTLTEMDITLKDIIKKQVLEEEYRNELISRKKSEMSTLAPYYEDDKYIYCGKEYSLEKHGYIRFKTFEVEKISETSVTLLHKSDEQTKVSYPFDYELRVGYVLLIIYIPIEF